MPAARLTADGFWATNAILHPAPENDPAAFFSSGTFFFRVRDAARAPSIAEVHCCKAV